MIAYLQSRTRGQCPEQRATCPSWESHDSLLLEAVAPRTVRVHAVRYRNHGHRIRLSGRQGSAVVVLVVAAPAEAARGAALAAESHHLHQ